ncbi:MAG TPA: hypothetical protein VMU76_11295 [Acidimicrobiales bacterium]|nr:hypothetical protein [Acidimicrobiales bacterium]
MAFGAHPIREDLAELLLALPADVLAHAAANKRALEQADAPPALEWELRELTVQDRAYRFATWCRDAGIDEDLIGVDIFGKLVELGYSEEQALAVLHDAGITWRPRTDEERVVNAAREMLADGWPEDVVRQAMRDSE